MSSRRVIAVDANLLVLLVVGLTDEKLVEKHKRTTSFQQDDFQLLTEILSGYEEILLTPHVLTEVSNLTSQIGDPAKSKIRSTFAALMNTHPEIYEKSSTTGKHYLFARLGLTDCGLLSLVENGNPLITVDLSLYLAACKLSDNVFNFNHIRDFGLLAT